MKRTLVLAAVLVMFAALASAQPTPTATQFVPRHGTTAEQANFIGVNGELTVDTDKHTVVISDGTTPGGHPLALESALNAHQLNVANPHGVDAAQVGAVALTDTGGGDVTGQFNARLVLALRGRPLAATQPVTNEVIKWDGASWGPGSITLAEIGAAASGDNTDITSLALAPGSALTNALSAVHPTSTALAKIFIGTTAVYFVQVGSAASEFSSIAQVNGDANQRFIRLVDGTFQWGDGTNAPDTNFYRSAANELTTDGALIVKGGIKTPCDPATQLCTLKLTQDDSQAVPVAGITNLSAGTDGKIYKQSPGDSVEVAMLSTQDLPSMTSYIYPSSDASISIVSTGDDACRCIRFSLPVGILDLDTVTLSITTPDLNDVGTEVGIFSSDGTIRYFQAAIDVSAVATRSLTNTITTPPAMKAGDQWLCYSRGNDANTDSYKLGGGLTSARMASDNFTCTGGVMPATISPTATWSTSTFPSISLADE